MPRGSRGAGGKQRRWTAAWRAVSPPCERRFCAARRGGFHPGRLHGTKAQSGQVWQGRREGAKSRRASTHNTKGDGFSAPLVLQLSCPVAFRRSAFVRDLRRLASNLAAIDPLVGLVATRFLRFRFLSWRRSLSLAKASSLFRPCNRCSVAVTVIPVGRCTSRTADSTLFRCCPPGPLPRYVWTETSCLRGSGSVALGSSGFIAVEACRRRGFARG